MDVVMILKYQNSGEFYYLNKQCHRSNQDKAACISWDGWKYWYHNGDCWRENGPALIYSNGESRHFFKDGIRQ